MISPEKHSYERPAPASPFADAGAYMAPLLALGVLAGTFLLSLQPHLHGPVCTFRSVFGIPCPGCGMTRSLTSIWHGNVLLSMRYHPLGLPIFLCCLVCILCFLGDRCFPRVKPYTARLCAFSLRLPTLLGITVGMFALWGVRLLLDRSGSHLFLW